MSILDKHVQRALSSDRSAAFIYDLATAMPPMSLSTLKAASDVFDRGTIEAAPRPFRFVGALGQAVACP